MPEEKDSDVNGRGPGRPSGVVLAGLSRERERLGLTKEALAEKAGVHRNTVSDAEAGGGKDWPTVERLAEALGVSAGRLREG